MTLGEIATVVVPTAIASAMYLYLLRERRKLHDNRLHPAE